MTVKPTVGRIVHYVSAWQSVGTRDATCRAAIVTDTEDADTASLAVFSGRGMFFYEKLTYDEGKAPGTWHWPERTEEPPSGLTVDAGKRARAVKA